MHIPHRLSTYRPSLTVYFPFTYPFFAYLSIFLLPGCHFTVPTDSPYWALSSSVQQRSSSLGGDGPTGVSALLGFYGASLAGCTQDGVLLELLGLSYVFEMQSTSFLSLSLSLSLSLEYWPGQGTLAPYRDLCSPHKICISQRSITSFVDGRLWELLSLKSCD